MFSTSRNMYLKPQFRSALLGSIGFSIFLMVYKNFSSFKSGEEVDFTIYNRDKAPTRNPNYALDTLGCKIPEIDPFDESIRNLTVAIPPYHCPCDDGLGLVYLEKGAVKVNFDILHRFPIDIQNETSMTDFHCCLWTMHRHEVEEQDDFLRYPSECIRFQRSIPVEDEYLKVDCFLGPKRIHETYLVNLVRKPEVEERCANALKTCRTHQSMGVIILFLDSVSRVNFRRNFPESRKVLVEELQAIEMHGYNRVADNTFPNMVPMLTGLSDDELRATCWRNVTKHFDDCPFVWKDFAAAGFRTAFVEDFPDIAAFNLEKPGFQRQPTDYYGHSFLKEAYKLMKQQRDCLNGIPEPEVVFRWCYDYVRMLWGDRHFGLFATSRFTHQSDINTARWADPILKKFLRDMKYDGLMDNTFLFVISDHGARYGNFRETVIGSREVNLPAFYVVSPKSFAEHFPEAFQNLVNNAHRLSTAYDVHETLRDIVQCRFVQSTANHDEARGRGISLFRTIPTDRKCLEAGIPREYCACYVSEIPLSHDLEVVQRAYHLLIDKLNSFTAPYRNICATFIPDYISRARQVHFLDSNNNVETVYEVTFGTEPGPGMFQGMVLKDPTDDCMTAFPEISRLDMYGSTSACIKHNNTMRKYCYCV